ncbi:MAG: hypothetical protein INR71_07370, partial [Terriglobus roseus]|nr:hypothetical protein [Terriglobus roseus]
MPANPQKCDRGAPGALTRFAPGTRAHCHRRRHRQLLTRSARSRRANGATQTFRRPSLATSLSSSAPQRDAAAALPTPTSATGVYVPPHATRNGAFADARYSKDQLLSLYKEQLDANALSSDLPDLFANGWEPLQSTNGASSSSSFS